MNSRGSNLDSPVVVVTGAGSGIGQAICVQLAREGNGAGCRIAMVGRDTSKLQATHGAVMQVNDKARTLILNADVSDQARCQWLADAVMHEWGRVDALINNAAWLPPSHPIFSINPDHLMRAFAVNVFGPAYLVAAFWRVFEQQKRGRVVNVSSMSAIDPFPGLSIYAASKSALESLTRSIMVEGRASGILAFSVAPGAVETQMLRSLVSREDLPTHRVLAPAVPAGLIVDCALGRCDDRAGQVIPVPSP